MPHCKFCKSAIPEKAYQRGRVCIACHTEEFRKLGDEIERLGWQGKFDEADRLYHDTRKLLGERD
jgi:cbb3-type cytochrome oxidase cytochrome c subunit